MLAEKRSAGVAPQVIRDKHLVKLTLFGRNSDSYKSYLTLNSVSFLQDTYSYGFHTQDPVISVRVFHLFPQQLVWIHLMYIYY